MDIKRAFDIAASGVGIVVLAVPVLVLTFTMAAITRTKPLFFVQERIGQDRKPFNLLKIETMNHACDEKGKLLRIDQRITKFGIFMRKSRLDELPQLINIFKGDMSLVGPRPTISAMSYANDNKRHSVKPGLTGLAQIAGDNVLSDEDILRLDHAYVDHHDLMGDLKIIFKTPLRLIQNRHLPHYSKKAEDSFYPPENVI